MADTTFNMPNPSSNTLEAYDYRIDMDGVLYHLTFRFNARDEFWYMDVQDGLDDTNLRMGVKLVSQWELLRTYKAAKAPEGKLTLIPQGADGLEAQTIAALGLDVLLTYTGQS